jgi:hypothetical protein
VDLELLKINGLTIATCFGDKIGISISGFLLLELSTNPLKKHSKFG